jgi:uncharacterized protein (DUF1330 family)
MGDPEVKGYWIVLSADVSDPEAQQTYGKLWAPIAEKYGAKLKPLDLATVLVEPQSTKRVLSVEFASYEQAKACYADPAYAQAKEYALKAANRQLLIIEADLA